MYLQDFPLLSMIFRKRYMADYTLLSNQTKDRFSLTVLDLWITAITPPGLILWANNQMALI